MVDNFNKRNFGTEKENKERDSFQTKCNGNRTKQKAIGKHDT